MSEENPPEQQQTIATLRDELVRCRAERDAALAHQTAIADVLQVINQSPGKLTPVFEAMVANALHLCEAAFGGLLRFDGECFHRMVLRNLPPALAGRNQPVRPVLGMALERLVRGENVVHVADITDDEAYRARLPGRIAMVELGGARSAVWVALRREERLLGAFVAYRQEVRPFSDGQVALLRSFADQTVVAIENARLLGELRARTVEIAAWNRELETRVATQLDELEQMRRLKRFLAPQLAERIVARGAARILKPHRRDIVVVFCDLRGFTAFSDDAEPEVVFHLLQQYHAAVGPVVTAAEGTVGHFAGDGIMVFFNDPIPCGDAAERAVHMALAMREAVSRLQVRWRSKGLDVGFGVGIAQGQATLGELGFADRVDYTANGAVCNLAARLCAEAKDGQILISPRLAATMDDTVALEEIGNLWLKGIRQPVPVHNVTGLRLDPFEQLGEPPAMGGAMWPDTHLIQATGM